MILTWLFSYDESGKVKFFLKISFFSNQLKDPSMLFPDIEDEKTTYNRTVLTMDLGFLKELWQPGKIHIFKINSLKGFKNQIWIQTDPFFPNEKSISQEPKMLRVDSSGILALPKLV